MKIKMKIKTKTKKNPSPIHTPNFRTELTTLLNRHSVENASNTPDFILAEYIQLSLKAFTDATNERDIWYRIKVLTRENNVI